MEVANSIEQIFYNCQMALDEGDCTKATHFLDQAIDNLNTLPSKHILWFDYFINRASVENNTGKFYDSLEFCKKAEAALPLKGYDYQKAIILSRKGTAYYNIGDFINATNYFKSAITIFKAANKKDETARELISLGKILLRQGNWGESIKLFSQSQLIAKKSKNLDLEAKALMELGFVFRGHRFLYLGIDHFREAEKIYKHTNKNIGLVTALYEIANTYLSLKMPSKTITIKSEIEKLTTPDSVMRKFLYNLDYCVYNQNKNFSEAMKCAEFLLAFFKSAHDKKGEADSLKKIASVFYNISDFKQAKLYASDSLALAIEIGDNLQQNLCREFLLAIDSIANNSIDIHSIRDDEFHD